MVLPQHCVSTTTSINIITKPSLAKPLKAAIQEFWWIYSTYSVRVIEALLWPKGRKSRETHPAHPAQTIELYSQAAFHNLPVRGSQIFSRSSAKHSIKISSPFGLVQKGPCMDRALC